MMDLPIRQFQNGTNQRSMLDRSHPLSSRSIDVTATQSSYNSNHNHNHNHNHSHNLPADATHPNPNPPTSIEYIQQMEASSSQQSSAPRHTTVARKPVSERTSRASKQPPPLNTTVMNPSPDLSAILYQSDGTLVSWGMGKSPYLRTPTGHNASESAIIDYRSDLEERRSVCQSPSWEAYTRRKQEKKGAKKEKERAAKDAKAKPRRLSKPPPSPVVNMRNISKTGHMASDTDVPSRRDRGERPASILGFPSLTPNKKEQSPTPQKRGRSGSFTSFFKPNFDIRRSSVDVDSDSGFVGGVKLDKQRQAANDKDLGALAKEIDVSDVHPALRDLTREEEMRNPLNQLQPPPPIDSLGVAQRRTYPPISMQTSPSTTTQSLISPLAKSGLEPSRLQKWRARVGLKMPVKSDDPQDKFRVPAAQPSKTNRPAKEEQNQSPVNKQSGNRMSRLDHPVRHIPTGSAPQLAIQDIASANARKRPSKEAQNLVISGPIIAEPPDSHEDKETSPTRQQKRKDGGLERTDTVKLRHGRSLSSPPPQIPRKSSKRNSMIALEASPALAPTPDSHSTSGSTNGFDSPHQQPSPTTPFTPPLDFDLDDPLSYPPGLTIAKNSSDKLHPGHYTQTTNRHQPELGAKTLGHSKWEDDGLLHPLALRQPRNSSSDDSCSEDFRSATSSGTADTSRSGSEKDASSPSLPSFAASAEKQHTKCSRQPSHVRGSGPVETAAKKRSSQPSFPQEPPRRRRSTDRRGQSDSGAKANLNYLPKIKQQQPPKGKSHSCSSGSGSVLRTAAPPPLDANPPHGLNFFNKGPVPAQSLEAARKAAPAAPPQQPRRHTAMATMSVAPPHTDKKLSCPTPAATSAPMTAGVPARDEQPLAKMFVECCRCRYYHDMPSSLYEAMSRPIVVGGPEPITVGCSWCEHEMSVQCCAGLAAMVYVKERFHCI